MDKYERVEELTQCYHCHGYVDYVTIEPASNETDEGLYYLVDDVDPMLEQVHELQESLIRRDTKIRDLERLRDGANDMLDRYSQLVDDWTEMYERLEEKHGRVCL